MHARTILVASGTLMSLGAAIPLVDRDVVWQTTVIEDVITIPVTQTVWVNPEGYSGTVSTTRRHFGHHGAHTTSSVVSTPAANPAPSSPAAVSTTSSIAVAASPEPVPLSSSSSAVIVAAAASSPPPAPAPAPAPTSSSTAVTTSTGSSALVGGMAAAGSSYTGEFTYYQTGLGACGWTNTASDSIVAVSHIIFDSYATAGGNANLNPVCGKFVTITSKDGSQHQAKVVDRCVSCAQSDLDLSQDLFNIVTDNGDGRVSGMKWAFT